MRNHLCAKPPQTILMTTDTVGGVWTYSVDLCRALTSAGINVVLATLGAPPSPEQQMAVRALPGVVLLEKPGRLEWMESPWKDIDETSQWLLRVRDRFEPDLIHLNDFSHGHLDWGVPVVVVGHSCVLSWWEAVKKEPAPPVWEEYRKRVTRGLQGATCVVAPTQAMLSSLERFYGPFREERVIYNAADPHVFTTEKKDQVIFTASRLWDEAKNAATLAAAAPHLPWRVTVAGDDHHPQGGRRRLPGVVTLGKLSREEVARWYARAGIYAHPARYEPFGLSVLEAALAQCPLVLGDIPTLRELWEGAAMFVNPEDIYGLTEVLRELAEDAPLRISLGTAARARGVTFSPTRMLEGYLDLYCDLGGGWKMNRGGQAASVARPTMN